MNTDSGERVTKKQSLYTNPVVIVICINAFVVSIGFGIVQPILYFFLLALEGEITEPPGPNYEIPTEVVAEYAIVFSIMLSAFMASRTLFARYWGGLSDRRGRKVIIVGGLMGYILCMALFGIARSWVELAIYRFGLGVVSAAVWPAGQAVLIDTIDEDQRGEGMGFYNFAMMIGWISGPGLGGILYEISRDSLQLPVPDVFRVPYFLAAAVIIPAPIVSFIVLKEPAKEQSISMPILAERPNGLPGRDSDASTTVTFSSNIKKMIYTLYFMNLMNGLAQGIAMPLVQLFIMAKITADPTMIGFIITIAGGIGMLMNIPAGRLSDIFGRKKLALWSGVASRGALASLPHTSTILETSISYTARSGAFSMSQPIMSAIQGDIVPAPIRGKIFGTLQAFNNAGATIGPIIGSWIFSMTALLQWRIGSTNWIIEGIAFPFWLGAIMGLIGLAFFAKNITETRPMRSVEEE